MSAERRAEEPSDETGSAAASGEESDLPPDELRGQLAVLEAENRRLRREYVRARQTTYRRTALGLLVVGLVAVVGGVLFPSAQTVLLALGGSAVVAGILTYFLTPETFVAASVGEAIYSATEATYESMRSDLGLTDRRVYAPLIDGGVFEARLFVPQHHEYTVPDSEALRRGVVVTDDPSARGLTVRPNGMELLTELQAATDASLDTANANNPERTFDIIADGLVEQFELADSIATTMEADSRCVVAVEGSVYGRVGGIDHPIASAFGVGIACALGAPVEVDVDEGDESYVLEYRWDSDERDTNDESTGVEHAGNENETENEISSERSVAEEAERDDSAENA